MKSTIRINMTASVLDDLQAVTALQPDDGGEPVFGFAVWSELLSKLAANYGPAQSRSSHEVSPNEARLLIHALESLAKNRPTIKARTGVTFQDSRERHAYTAQAIRKRVDKWDADEAEAIKAVNVPTLERVVRSWAKENAHDVWAYGSWGMSWDRALSANVINRTQHKAARRYYGERWDRGGE